MKLISVFIFFLEILGKEIFKLINLSSTLIFIFSYIFSKLIIKSYSSSTVSNCLKNLFILCNLSPVNEALYDKNIE